MNEKAIQDAMHTYIETGFSNQALNEIYLGLQSGIDVQDFAKREYNALQMRCLRLAKEEGLEIDLLLNPDLTHKQMELLRDGLSKGIDIQELNHPDISCERIQEQISIQIAKKKDGPEKPSLESLLSSTAQKEPKGKTEEKWEGVLKPKNYLDISGR